MLVLTRPGVKLYLGYMERVMAGLLGWVWGLSHDYCSLVPLGTHRSEVMRWGLADDECQCGVQMVFLPREKWRSVNNSVLPPRVSYWSGNFLTNSLAWRAVKRTFFAIPFCWAFPCSLGMPLALGH